MGAESEVHLHCWAFDQGSHRVGTKGSLGRCSWTENCPQSPVASVDVEYQATGRRLRYALCPEHHFRVHQYFDIREATPVVELQHLLEYWAVGFADSCRRKPTHPEDAFRSATLSVGRRGIHEDEAQAFLRAWREKLVLIDIAGRFTVPAARACPPVMHLVGRSGNRTALHTEYLIQIGVIAELIQDQDWALPDLAFEQDEWDLLGYKNGRVSLAVEAKARPLRPDADSLEALRDSFVSRSIDPTVPLRKNHERKWRALEEFVTEGPVTVLLVASGARWWFDAAGFNGRLTILPRV